MTARQEVLGRIRRAVGESRAPLDVPRDYRVANGQAPGSQELVELFIDRLEDYKAHVYRASTPAQVAEQLAGCLSGRPTVVVPPALPASWQAAIAACVDEMRVDGQPVTLSALELDAVAAVVTACRVAVAETGTLVLDAEPDQGRRALTLVPDHHVVVVFARQVVATVPDALQRLDPARPLTFVSGPSATSDIEFSRVEGVHGPRRLDVIVVSDAESA